MHKLNKSKKHRVSRTYLGLGLIAAPAVVSGAVLSSAYVFAGNTAVDTIDLNLPISCRVSATGMNSHTTTAVNGTYTDDIGTTTMKIICNDNGGFSVYAAGYTGDVIGETNSTRLVGTAASGNSTIITGTAEGPGYSEDVSNWAMKLESDSYDYPITILDYYDYYHTVPSLYAKVATRSSGTDVGAEANGAVLKSTYAVYISKTQPADTYTGKVKYTLVHPNNAPAPVSLYLQNTGAIANALPNIGDTVSAVDIRDGKEYTVGKLPDGKIWLLDNLALDLTASGASTNITAANTNASAASLSALFTGDPTGGDNGNLARSAVSSQYGSSYTEPYTNANYKDTAVEDITSASVGGDWTLGSYYNYCAASAGNYCYDSSTEGTATAQEDICPKGWRLPTYYSRYDSSTDDSYEEGDYHDLLEEYYYYDSDPDYGYYDYEAFVTALRLPLSGHYQYSLYGVATSGYFWSSSKYEYNDYSMNNLYLDADYRIQYAELEESERTYLYPIRCLMNSQ